VWILTYGTIDLWLATTFFTNIIVVLLTAGRIWWIGRKSGAILGPSTLRRVNSAIAIILESGIIYPVSIILAGTLFITRTPFVVYGPFIAIAYQAVAIAPTLMIVRVSLGVSTDDVESSVENLSGPTMLSAVTSQGMNATMFSTIVSCPPSIQSRA